MGIAVGHKAVIIFPLARITKIKMGTIDTRVNFYDVGSFKSPDKIWVNKLILGEWCRFGKDDEKNKN